MGEAGNWPAGVKVVVKWLPVRERALASGMFNGGSTVGVTLAPPIIAWIVLRLGWQAAFLLIGVLGFDGWLLGLRFTELRRVHRRANTPRNRCVNSFVCAS
jgi:ACS family hexuronate transporter-like MFS transporter